MSKEERDPFLFDFLNYYFPIIISFILFVVGCNFFSIKLSFGMYILMFIVGCFPLPFLSVSLILLVISWIINEHLINPILFMIFPGYREYWKRHYGDKRSYSYEPSVRPRYVSRYKDYIPRDIEE